MEWYGNPFWDKKYYQNTRVKAAIKKIITNRSGFAVGRAPLPLAVFPCMGAWSWILGSGVWRASLDNTYFSSTLRIMKTKLTLSVEPEVVARAKRLAGKRGVSVSALFEQWSSGLAKAEGRPSLGARLRGRWKGGPEAKADARLEYLLEKHGSR